MGKHLKQKSAPVKTARKKSAARKQPVKSAPPRKTFLDMIAPGVLKFNPDVYIRDNLYCCVWALKEYPAATEDQAILRHLGEKCGISIRIYTRIVDAMEENRIIQNATNKNRLSRANTNDTKQMITAEGNLQDVFEMVNAMRKRREPLIHCAVFIELCAPTMQELERLQSEVKAAERMATELAKRGVNTEIIVPTLKDWNDDLREEEHDWIQSSGLSL